MNKKNKQSIDHRDCSNCIDVQACLALYCWQKFANITKMTNVKHFSPKKKIIKDIARHISDFTITKTEYNLELII